jgi:hypothetical protein
VGGIHWHMNVGNRIEYVATDEARQKIPWVRMTDAQGVVTEFRSARFTNQIDEASVRRMDCMDCHNRPAHRYESPNDAVNLAMALGKIDRTLPYIKTNALFALTRHYTNETQALQGIATILCEHYPNEARIRPAIDVVQQIYTNNFFPDMKASWQVYPRIPGTKIGRDVFAAMTASTRLWMASVPSKPTIVTLAIRSSPRETAPNSTN